MRDVDTFEHIPLRFILQERTNSWIEYPRVINRKRERRSQPQKQVTDLGNYRSTPTKRSRKTLRSHPRLESHGQHPDSDFIPSDEDGDHEALHPAFGSAPRPTSPLALPPQAIWALWLVIASLVIDSVGYRGMLVVIMVKSTGYLQ